MEDPTQTADIVWHVVVHQPYASCKAVFEGLAPEYLIGEHEADESIKRTHTHAMLVNPTVGAEGIRKRIKSHGFGGRGNFAILTVAEKSRQPYDKEKLGIYILKGKESVCKDTTLEEEEILRWVGEWVQPVRQEPAAPQTKKEQPATHYELIVKIVMDTRGMNGVWEHMMNLGTDNEGVALEDTWVCRNRKAVWNYMIKVLNENKVRTSRNELERFFVSILRHDREACDRMYENIIEKIF